MINFNKRSLQSELDSFFQTLKGTLTPIREVTKGAFCHARLKLMYSAFIELNRHLISFFTMHFPLRTWHGFRLLAIDGTTFQIPKTAETLEHFGTQPDSAHLDCPMARSSQLYDILNHLTLDAVIHPYRVDERELAVSHASAFQPNDLVLLDRGYPAFWFFAWLLSQSVHFCARVSLSSWSEVKRFASSDQKEQIITIYPTQPSKEKCHRYGLSIQPIKVRLIRVSLSGTEDHILITSLLDDQALPHAFLQDLYRLRWGIEENYKQMKCRVEMANFSGKSVESIYQDFHAKVFSMNLASAFIHPVQDLVDQNTDDKKYRYQANRTFVFSTLKDSLIQVFQRIRPYRLITNLLTIIQKTLEPVRPGRSFPRKKSIRDRPTFFMNYKPTA
jgi:hypothetical protein